MKTIEKKHQETLKSDIEATLVKKEEFMIAYDPEVINKIGEYLSQKPWVEVNELLNGLNQGKPIKLS